MGGLRKTKATALTMACNAIKEELLAISLATRVANTNLFVQSNNELNSKSSYKSKSNKKAFESSL